MNYIQRAFKKREERNWDKTYWAIDIHDTVITSTYKSGNVGAQFFPHAVPTLQLLTQLEDHVLIAWTSSSFGDFRYFADPQSAERGHKRVSSRVGGREDSHSILQL